MKKPTTPRKVGAPPPTSSETPTPSDTADSPTRRPRKGGAEPPPTGATESPMQTAPAAKARKGGPPRPPTPRKARAHAQGPAKKPRASAPKPLGLKDLAREIAKRCPSLTEAKALAALNLTNECIKEVLETGLPVHVEGIGTFSPEPGEGGASGKMYVAFTPEPEPRLPYS